MYCLVITQLDQIEISYHAYGINCQHWNLIYNDWIKSLPDIKKNPEPLYLRNHEYLSIDALSLDIGIRTPWYSVLNLFRDEEAAVGDAEDEA